MTITFKHYLKENYIDSEKDVNYYQKLASNKRILSASMEEPRYSKVFAGRCDNDDDDLLNEEAAESLQPKPREGIGNDDEKKLISGIDFKDYVRDMPRSNEVEGEIPDRDSTAELEDTLKNHYGSLPQEKAHEIRSISNYTGSDHYPINKHLLGIDSYSYIGENALRDIDNIKTTIGRYTTPRSFKVMTGVKIDPSTLPTFANTIHFTNPAFTSTSVRYNIADGFARRKPILDKDGYEIHSMSPGNRYYTEVSQKHILHLTIPSGAHGFYTEPYTLNTGEYEFLLHPEAKFKLWHKPSVFRSHINPLRVVVNHWHGVLVHDGIKAHPLTPDHWLHPSNTMKEPT